MRDESPRSNVANAEGRIQNLLSQGNDRRADLHKRLDVLREKLQPIYSERPSPKAGDSPTLSAAPESAVALSLISANNHTEVMIDLVTTLIESVQL